MHIEPTVLSGAWIVSPTVYTDHRGSFRETYRDTWFTEMGLAFSVCQSNQSTSKKGVLRGLHFQHPPHAQAKLIRVIKGRIWDVGVDIDPHSPTYRQWIGVELTDEHPRSLWLSPKMAHGFIVLSDYAIVSYDCSMPYRPDAEGGIRWDDPTLAIHWPEVGPILVSDKDRALPFLNPSS